MQTVGQISLLVYGTLVLIGGVAGFLKAKSKASLISGLVSGVLMLTAYFISNSSPSTGLVTGIVVTNLLIVVFAIRLAKTKKFMPSGMLLLLSVMEEVLLILAMLNKA